MTRGRHIGIRLAWALVMAIAAPARGADLMPLSTDLADVRYALADAQLLVVERLGNEQDAAGLPPHPWDPPFTVVQRDTASAAWAAKFKRLMLSAGHYSVFGRCSDLDSLGHIMPARFRVTLVGRSHSGPLVRHFENVWIRFRSGLPCAQFGTAKSPGGSLELLNVSDSLLALLREAVEADSFVGSAADSLPRAHTPSSAAGGPGVRTSAHGDWVFVEVLPEATERVPPEYPIQARVDGVSGTVLVIALISPEGRVADAFVQDSIPELDLAAMDAVRRWKFKPATTAGKPLAVWVAIPVKFTLH